MELFFCSNVTARNVEFNDIFKIFAELVEDRHDARAGKVKPKTKPKPARPRKGKGKKKATGDEDGDDDDYSAGDIATMHRVQVDQFLSGFKITPNMFIEEVEKTYASVILHMPTSFTHHDRLSSHLGTRLLAVSGLSWNQLSRNKRRDHTNIAVAITLEGICLASYRSQLLGNSGGPNTMRDDLFQYFHLIARPHSVAFSGKGVQPRNYKPTMKAEWAFADFVSIVDDSDGKIVDYGLDPIELKESLDNARIKRERLKKDVRTKFANAVLKNELLFCSDPSVPKGTLETSAYLHIVALLDVRFFTIHTLPAHSS